MTYRITDARFLKQLSRHHLKRRSTFLDRCHIDVEDSESDIAGLAIYIGTRHSTVIRIAWARQRAWLLTSKLLSADELSAGELSGCKGAFTDLVRRCLVKHKLIDACGYSTRRRRA